MSSEGLEDERGADASRALLVPIPPSHASCRVRAGGSRESSTSALLGEMTTDSIAASWSRIRAWLLARAPREARRLGPPADEAALDEISRVLPFALPEDLRASARVCDGQDLGAIAGYRLLSLREAVAERERAIALSDGTWTWSAGWLPLLTDGGGNYHFVDLESGAVRAWDHELMEAEDVAPSIAALLAWYADALERGVYKTTREGLVHKELKGPGGLCQARPVLLDRLLKADLPLDEVLWKALRKSDRAELVAAIDARLAQPQGPRMRNRATMLRAWLVGRDGAAWCSALPADGEVTLATFAYAASRCLAKAGARAEVLARSQPLLGTHRAVEALGALTLLADPKLVVWCEEHVAMPVVHEWGLLAASASPSWSTIRAWLTKGAAHELMALDAILYAQPRGVRIAAEHGLGAAVPESLEAVPFGLEGQPLSAHVTSELAIHAVIAESTPRIRQTLDAIADALSGRPRD